MSLVKKRKEKETYFNKNLLCISCHVGSFKQSTMNFVGSLNVTLTCFGTDGEKSTVVGRVI